MNEPTYEELFHENRRLRSILGALARAGLGVGAMVEIYAGQDRAGVVVCRADRDEVQFCEDVREALRELAASLRTEIEDASARLMGVTAQSETMGHPLHRSTRDRLEGLAREVAGRHPYPPVSREVWAWTECDVFEGTWLRWRYQRGPVTVIVRVPTAERLDLFNEGTLDEALAALSAITGRPVDDLLKELRG